MFEIIGDRIINQKEEITRENACPEASNQCWQPVVKVP
jgi:hypothetical protein